MTPLQPVYIAIGSNQDQPAIKIREAIRQLHNSAAFQNVRVSRLQWTDPVGPVEQAQFLNGAISAQTTWNPECLLALLHAFEQNLGRNRDAETHWGPRPIDLDLLMLGDLVYNTHSVKIPHPEMAKRRFVLEPLSELAPNAVHPVNNLTAADMLEALCG